MVINVSDKYWQNSKGAKRQTKSSIDKFTCVTLPKFCQQILAETDPQNRLQDEDLTVCSNCLKMIRAEASPAATRLLDLSRQFHLVGMSCTFSGRVGRLIRFKIRIRDPVQNWVRQLQEDPLDLQVRPEGKVLSILVAPTSGK
jgi:hypothetical protein